MLYPKNNISNNPTYTPTYEKNNTEDKTSRYSIYRKITNLNFPVLEIKLENKITNNATYIGYYYTTKVNDTLYSIAKEYYGSEQYWWILAKANNLKDDMLSVLPANFTINIPAMSELNVSGGYFSNVI